MRQLLATTIFVLLAVGITFAKPGDGLFQPSSGESREKLSWQTDIKPALAMAAENYQPVVTVFTMPTCLWCKRLKQDVLTLPEHTSLLENYVRVEIDISRDPETAARYGIRSVPAILILSSDGTTRDASHGLIEPARLQLMLKGALNSEFLRKNDEAFNATLKLLNSPPVPAEAWPGILSALGDKLKREDLKNAILDIAPFPKKELITFLQHERLAVRLGTLEILESKAGTHFNYDPWLDTADTDANRIALEDWVKWAADKPNIDTVSPLREITDDEFDTLIVDLVSDNRSRRERAIITLKQGGPNIIPRLGKIITDRAGLPSGDILRLKAAQYTLIIPRDSAVEGSVIAQRLLFGNLDARIGAIGNLQDLKADGVPVLAEFINDPEPLVRETVIDALIKSGGQHVQPLLVAQLDRETDKNVTYTILKNLGTLETKTALSKLISYAAHENEDFAVIAIEGIRNLDNKTPDVIKVIGNGLKDPRWRVRVASIQTSAKLNDPKLTPGVIQTTQDEDEFVQQAAIEAIAKIGTKQSLSDLTPLFNQRPAIRPAIIKAYVSKKATIPDAILDLLEKDSPDVLLPALDIMGNSSSFKQVDFLQKFINHENTDIAAAALRAYARRTDSQPEALASMQQIFNENSPSKIRAILSNFDFSYDSLKLIRPAIKRNNGGSSTPSGNSPSDAIINSFLTEYHRFAAEAVTPVSDKIAALVEFVHSVEKLLDHSDPQLALEAAMLIVETGSPAPYPLLLRQIETLTTSQKRSLLYDIDENSPDEALPLLRTLLRDASSNIRELAASAAFENSANERFLSSPFEELVSPASPLRPTEVFNYELSNMLENTTGKSIAGKWARQILDADYSSDTMRAFALSILAQAWTPADSDRALPLIASDNLYIRRAAWYAIAKNDTQRFTSDLKLVMAESSELVRAVIPAAYASHSFEWVNYFDSNQFATSDEGNSRNRLEAPVLESLHRLTRDPSAKISIEAFFSLMSNSEEIDIDRFMSAVGKLPDRDAIGERIADYLSDNYSRLDKSPEKGLQRLLQFLDYHDSDYEKERIYKHFNASPDKETINLSLNEIAPGKKENDTAATPATSNLPDAQPPPDTPVAAPPEVVRLVYFFKPGCDVCETVSDDLHKLSEKHKIQVDRYDIETVEAKLFNETLCERFDVPENIRLVAPAIFTTAGFSIKTDATRQKIERLIRDSFEMPADETWHVMQEAQLAAAENVIVERFSSLRLGVIISAGLLDGINPCAFATIIFFLSYLAVAGRNSRQILQVGIAFIFGVFIAYFLLGLGLMQIAVKIQQYQWISRSVNYLMAALAIVIMIICIKDGILCLRGRLADTSLQLPAFLKKRINSVIRKGARHSRFVIAAFVVGLIISALELACTGQVYLPTIMFAIQSGQSNAIAYLAIFNIAFVVPLIIIFLLAFFGMKSDALIRFQAKHSAAVKFATAILFFALAAFLIFGDKLLNPPSSAPAPSVEIIEST